MLRKKKEAQPPIIDDNDILPIAGPITGKIDVFAVNDSDVESHVADQELSAIHPKKFTILSARQINTMKKRNMQPNLYANPMQHLDYKIYESLMKHTFVGALADAFIKYLVGNGFKIELELNNPDENNDTNAKLIEKNQNIITNLMEIEKNIDSDDDDGGMDVTFKQKISAVITSALMYNRGALIFQFNNPVTIDGKTYNDIPDHAIFAHAQDLGIIEIDPYTRKLKKVQWRHSFGEYININEMLYLWNSISSSKVHNAWFYGISILSPLISASKMLRQILSEDFPAMAKTTWAGLFLLVVKNEGNTKESKIQEYNAIAKALKPGRPGILIKDPEDTAHYDIKFDPKITEFRELFESMIKFCISVLGLPQVGFYDEAATNRSTMAGKLDLTMKTTMEPMRNWIGDEIIRQSYGKWFKKLYKDKPEILKTFRLKLSWSDIHILEWSDKIEAVLELDGRRQMKDSEFGELVGVDNYESMIDPNSETIPGGQGNKMSMSDGRGNEMQIKTKKGDK